MNMMADTPGDRNRQSTRATVMRQIDMQPSVQAGDTDPLFERIQKLPDKVIVTQGMNDRVHPREVVKRLALKTFDGRKACKKLETGTKQISGFQTRRFLKRRACVRHI